MHVRRKLVVGNWKMNGSLAQLAELHAIADAAREAGGVDVGICPPFTLIPSAVARSGGLLIGAQDCHAKASGAHTGCISTAMIKEAGARAVIAGHSERRADQHETDAEVRAKADAALRDGLVTIVCVGETDGMTVALYGLVTIGAALRVASPFLPFDYLMVLRIAGACWGGAFLLFILAYGPKLLGPRADGPP